MIKRFITFILCLSIIFCMGIGFTGCNQGTPVTSDNAGTTTPLAEDTTTPPAEDTTTPPVEDTTDEIIASLVHIEARHDFAFRYDLTNTTAGEKSPIENDY